MAGRSATGSRARAENHKAQVMTDNPYLKRMAQHVVGRSGRASEVKTTRRMGGKATPASGAMQGAKGDMNLGQFLIEAKSTTSDSMALKLEWLAKISSEARSKGKTPAIAVTFITPDGTPVMNGKWVVLPEYLFDEFVTTKEG